MNKELIIAVKGSGLDKTKSEIILDSFTNFFEQAKEWESKAKAIIITDISQTKEMELAREARLALKKIRCDAEKIRKKLKEQSNREGKAIDGIANIIKAVVVPLEEHLEKQEKFIVIKEQERKAKRLAIRIKKLARYVEDISVYNLEEMSKEGFYKLLESSKIAFESQQLAEAEAEKERIAKEKEDETKRQEMIEENKKLKEEADIKAKADEVIKAKADKEREVIEARERKEREAKEKLQREIKEKKEDDDRIERERVAQIEADNQAIAEQNRQDELRPEKEKLFAYAEQIKSIEPPQDISKAGLDIIRIAEEQLLNVSQVIKESIKNL